MAQSTQLFLSQQRALYIFEWKGGQNWAVESGARTSWGFKKSHAGHSGGTQLFAVVSAQPLHFVGRQDWALCPTYYLASLSLLSCTPTAPRLFCDTTPPDADVSSQVGDFGLGTMLDMLSILTSVFFPRPLNRLTAPPQVTMLCCAGVGLRI